MTTDPIASLLTQVRNAARARHTKTAVPYSRLKCAVLEVLKKQHFIDDFRVEKAGTFQEILIHLNPSRSQISLKRISKPGQRIYITSRQIKPVMNGYGIGVISTPQGMMTTREARQKKLGGELICEVW